MPACSSPVHRVFPESVGGGPKKSGRESAPLVTLVRCGGELEVREWGRYALLSEGSLAIQSAAPSQPRWGGRVEV